MAKKSQQIEWLEECTNSDWQHEYEQPTPSTTRKRKTMEFIGWGSKQLIRFLKSIGRDTSLPISQFDLAAIVNDYVDRSLPQQEIADYTQIPTRTKAKKKKRVLCDEKLKALFSRKSISRVMIHKMLERHLAEANQPLNSDDSQCLFTYGNEEDFDGEEEVKLKRSRKVKSSGPQSLFAAVIPQNLKLVYLRRSLIQEILKQENNSAELESKIVGSFVRIKTDPNDCLHKHSHHILQVTGLKVNSASEDENSKILLRAFGEIKDISVGMLSDEDFSEEECDELRQKINDGVLEKLTVEALQQQTNTLHKDVITHWLPRELAILQNLIDRANEKGWRREMYEYLERQELLESKEEQSRLLMEIPKVVPEAIESEAVKPSFIDIIEEIKDSPSEEIFKMEDPVSDLSDGEFQLTWAYSSEESEPDKPVQEGDKKTKNSPKEEGLGTSETEEVNKVENQKIETQEINNGVEIETPERVTEQKSTQTQQVNGVEKETPKRVIEQIIIDSSDEDDDVSSVDPTTEEVWNYLDPLGEIQGPHSMASLKDWNEQGYFTPDFRIWRTGQTPNEAVNLEHILTRNFPKRSARTKAP